MIGHIGGDQIGEAIAASQAKWVTTTGQTVAPAGNGDQPYAIGVVLAPVGDQRTAVAGAYLSASFGKSPLLFTGKDGLDPRTAAEITRLLGQPVTGSFNIPDPKTGVYYMDTVTILGGDAIPASVDAALAKIGYHVRRLAADPFAAIAAAAPGFAFGADDSGSLTLASIDDPVSVARLVAERHGQVLLTDGAKIPAADLPALDSVKASNPVHAIGDQAAAALAGSWSGKPAALHVTPAPADAGFSGPVVLIPTGSPQDAGVGAVLAVELGARLYFEDPASGLGPQLTQYLDTHSTSTPAVYVVDGTGRFAAADTTISSLIGGPLGARIVNGPQAVDPNK
jgi:hypothetical protein